MADANEQVTPHFTRGELACKCCGELVMVREAVDKLEQFRISIGIPFSPNCFYRCPKHNEEVGGAHNSYHMRGMAVDIPVKKGMDHDRIVRIAQDVGFRGIEICSTWVHVDVREGFWLKDMR